MKLIFYEILNYFMKNVQIIYYMFNSISFFKTLFMIQ